MKLSSFTDNIILYVENPKEYIKKITGTNISKVIEYKISIQRTTLFVYTNNEQSKNKIWRTILFTITSKRIKFIEINLTT